ncbi:hypothetical protein QJS10_CPA01g00415 [Acorus calamus]|uniref:U6 small nuclear RNA (adenine-(43)-N(6))-methyltransferase n=1 Tax=Acorus calamus TaxID=4465 RepID=A0AAV9FF56_ACOCL|nr:hypothetical protein QJS10_CPA01g00415 [Acorus calamus]
MPNKKKRRIERPTIHPRNRYSENPPDFAALASLYPSFQPFVSCSRDGRRSSIDWTDFNATRELTRVLLHHDHGINWWIPDGQLCPTVTNRSNYIHWINDLLSLELFVRSGGGPAEKVRGFDIGTGANCIYPLLGASLYGWSFVGSDVSDVALEWAKWNVDSNSHLVDLIEIRKAGDGLPNSGGDVESPLSDWDKNGYHGPPVLVGVVGEDERFEFCMCNPPFFESMEEAGLNPRTACGGTTEEMVCPGGEQAFVIRIIEDSVVLKESFRWFTSMIGRKANLKALISKLREAKVTVLKTTEFVQGQTARWGLAWSFMPPNRKAVASLVPEKSNCSFMLEGLPRRCGAIQVLKAVELFFLANSSSCKLDLASFIVSITVSQEHVTAILRDDQSNFDESAISQHNSEAPNNLCSEENMCFRVSVFEQIPGTLLVRGSLSNKKSPISGSFSAVFQHLEEALKKEFTESHKRGRT